MSTPAVAIIYTSNGPVETALSALHHTLPVPIGTQVLAETVCSPINPSDVRQVTGANPFKQKATTKLGTDHPVTVGGNEGLFRVLQVGKDSPLKAGDLCIPRVPGLGTWRTHILCDQTDLVCVPSSLTVEQAATIGVNPLTAYQLLTQFVDLQKGNWVLQNGGNSAVGKLITQMARIMGVNTISVVREREDFESVAEELRDLGATQVITDTQNQDLTFSVAEWIGNSSVRIAFNCVGGTSASALVKKLSQGGTLVTYGALNGADLVIPFATPEFVFKGIVATGYWLTANIMRDPELKIKTLEKVYRYYQQGLLKAPSFSKARCSFEDFAHCYQ
ncbi:hypothetical protein BABINDRAFT_179021 [Babjeviella inositovora NRRL Y-12698]|uniref:enoyl-[acyl-carrier-protein] reductase n=1 Tax=Babjeviella inositovora NRRL Y-12698 TaxID=984486 RepID=A0A1E3QZ69_9ASCO|nr:uncharacterized protein BABINDRAFT_179021 [Babjeviella inositovora NRRL Y-12698]ODQ82979.1 hypothetical protein BABINDRAFT_179021 [Babjeviella inositovora NRRL Y-12698]